MSKSNRQLQSSDRNVSEKSDPGMSESDILRIIRIIFLKRHSEKKVIQSAEEYTANIHDSRNQHQ